MFRYGRANRKACGFYEAYKAHRQEAPEDLTAAIPDIKKIIRGLNIPIIESDGYEADDVIGTLSKQAESLGYEVYMVTPDKDYGQLVSDKVKIYKPGYQGGDVEIMGPKEVCEKWCIDSVDQVVDILGLMGDAVDNIPGIAGVGQKTACKLLTEYKTLENVLAHADEIKGALGEKVRAGKDNALLSKKLATIITSVPVEFHEGRLLASRMLNKDLFKEVFNDLEFKTISKRLLGDESGSETGAVRKGRRGRTNGSVRIRPQKRSRKPSPWCSRAKTFIIHRMNMSWWKARLNSKSCWTPCQKHTEISFDTETTGLDANDC
jgi:DNA polymerase-1